MRRATTELELPDIADQRCWYAAETLGLADGATVENWFDVSGNGLHLGSGGGASPTYRAASVNGLASIEFDGSVDLFNRSATSMSPTTGRWTVFAVVLTDSVTGTRFILNGDDASNPRGSQFLRINNNTVQSLPNAAATEVAGPTISTATWYVLEAVRTATDCEAFVDGVGNGATARGSPSEPADRLTMGAFDDGSLRWDGKIAEVIGYARDLTSTERGEVRGALGTRYGISVS